MKSRLEVEDASFNAHGEEGRKSGPEVLRHRFLLESGMLYLLFVVVIFIQAIRCSFPCRHYECASSNSKFPLIVDSLICMLRFKGSSCQRCICIDNGSL